MTHVLMSVDTVGGVWTYALDLTDALAARGVTVSLATMGPGMSADQRSAVVESSVAAVHESSFALEWMADPWADVDRAGQCCWPWRTTCGRTSSTSTATSTARWAGGPPPS